MLHLFAFTVTCLLFLSCAAGLSLMLIGARGRILTALRRDVAGMSRSSIPASRVRVMARTHDMRFTPPLRAAA